MKILTGAFCALCLMSTAAFAETHSKPVNGEFGNLCAMGLTMGKQVQTDCQINWTDSSTGKTYCFSNEEMKKTWAQNIKPNIEKANNNYSKSAHQG